MTSTSRHLKPALPSRRLVRRVVNLFTSRVGDTPSGRDESQSERAHCRRQIQGQTKKSRKRVVQIRNRSRVTVAKCRQVSPHRMDSGMPLGMQSLYPRCWASGPCPDILLVESALIARRDHAPLADEERCARRVRIKLSANKATWQISPALCYWTFLA